VKGGDRLLGESEGGRGKEEEHKRSRSRRLVLIDVDGKPTGSRSFEGCLEDLSVEAKGRTISGCET